MCVCVRPRTISTVTTNDILGDVDFLVGEPAQKFTARRDVLTAASPVFEALFTGPLCTHESVIEIPDVDPRAFEVLLRHVDSKEIDLRSGTTALSTLYAAHKYLLPSLVRICSEYLTQSLQLDNALDIYLHARLYSTVERRTPSPASDRVPTAPPECEAPTEPPALAAWSAVLLSRCLDFIDHNAEQVLLQEAIEDLDLQALRDLLSRDSLRCHELTVFRTLDRWSERECRRRCLTPTPANRRLCLAEILFLVRFPYLTPEEFMCGPLQSDLLTPEETKFFSALFTSSDVTVPFHLQKHLARMQTPRHLALSDNRPADSKISETKKKSKGWLRRSSKTDKTLEKVKKTPEKEKRCSGSCFADSLIDVLVCIFD